MNLKMYMLLLLLLLTGQSKAQEPGWQWLKQTNAKGLTNPAVAANGNIYVAGIFQDSITLQGYTVRANRPGLSNGYIAQYTPAGSIVFAKGIGPCSEAWTLRVGALGNLFLEGQVNDTSQFGPPGALVSTYFFAKLDAQANLIWSKTFVNDLSSFNVRGFATDRNERVVMAGAVEQTAIIGQDTIRRSGPTRIALFAPRFSPAMAIFNADGTPARAIALSGSGSFSGAAFDAAGNICLAGYVDTGITFGTGFYKAEGSMFVAKFSPGGQMTWATASDGLSSERTYVSSFALTNDDDLVIAGLLTDTLQFGSQSVSTNNKASFIARFNSSGQIRWLRKLERGDYGALQSDNSNGIYFITSYRDSIVIGNRVHHGARQYPPARPSTAYGTSMICARFADNGLASWSKNLYTRNSNYIYARMGAASASADNALYLSGFYTDTLKCGSLMLVDTAGSTRIGPPDTYFLAKLSDAPNSIASATGNRARFDVYPNPSLGQFTISLPAGTFTGLSVIDQSGRTLFRQEVMHQAGRIELNLTALTSGLYYVQLTGINGASTSKIVITH